VSDLILQRGKCTYWGCTNYTQGIYCRDHQPAVCRICGCEPYGSRKLTYGMCLRHYKYWARHHSPQRPAILAYDRRRAARKSAKRRENQAKAREAAQVVPLEPWKPASEAERLQIGGWSSGACLAGPRNLILIDTGA
jgi:hypothetical protein